jgi:hypothetical protein
MSGEKGVGVDEEKSITHTHTLIHPLTPTAYDTRDGKSRNLY